MNKFLLVLIIALFSVSCATTLRVEPNDTNNSLIVGQIQLTAKYFKVNGPTTVNGTHASDMRLTFKRSDNNEEFTIRTKGQEGLYYFGGEPNVEYTLVKVVYKKKNSNGSWSTLTTRRTSHKIKSLPNSVINLGFLNWEAYNSKKNSVFEQDFSRSELKTYLEENYPDSQWLSYDWVKTSMFKEESEK